MYQYSGKDLFNVNPDVFFEQKEDGSVTLIFLNEDESYFKIEGVSVDVWKGISNEQSLEQIESEVLSNYQIDKEQLQKDMTTFISDLLKAEIISKK